MKQIYKAGTKSHLSFNRGEKFSLVFSLTIVFILVVGLSFLLIKNDTNKKGAGNIYSKTVIKPVNFDSVVTKTPYFQFEDDATWQLDNRSHDGFYILNKYIPNTQELEHQLTVAINNDFGYDFSSNRVLPVTINDNKLVPTQVSESCGGQFARDELHLTKLRSVFGTTIICDPDNSQYKVMVGQSGGDYHLKLQRFSGEIANYIIMYRNVSLKPQPQSLYQVINTFKAI